MEKYVLALDQGTTSSRAVLFDGRLQTAGVSQIALTQYYPKAGWVEHDPMEILSTQAEAMRRAIAASGVQPEQIAAIGIANQRETAVLWDRASGKPVSRAIVWQCRRTAPIVEDLRARGLEEEVRARTGLVLDAYFSGSKVKWLLDHTEGARLRAQRGDLLFGTVDSWLLWNLTGGACHATDYTNASRTMLFNIHTLCWDDTLLGELDIPPSVLPQVRDSGGFFSTADIGGHAVPVYGMMGDQQAALFGQGCFSPGEAKNTYGTGCFLLMHTGSAPHESKNHLLTTIASGLGGKICYALEGSVFAGGSVIQWLRDEIGLLADSSEAEKYARMAEDTGGVYIVPAFTGLGAPYWDMRARGCIVGITRGTRREHVVRAAEECIAYQSLELAEAMQRDAGYALTRLQADGGASRDGFLMQFQADVLGVPVCRPANTETTALGAAVLAGLAAGVWQDKKQILPLLGQGAVFRPAMPAQKRQELLAGWRRAVKRSLDWAEE